jgi:hypothetical protein
LLEILNSPQALQFRKTLDIATDPICRHCVCSLYIPASEMRAGFGVTTASASQGIERNG